MTTKYDPLEGVKSSTTKEELMNRLRRAATELRKGDRAQKAKLSEIEARLREKGLHRPEELRQVICSATDAEWKDAIEFLEEFDDLLPVALSRLLIGGRVLMEQIH